MVLPGVIPSGGVSVPGVAQTGDGISGVVPSPSEAMPAPGFVQPIEVLPVPAPGVAMFPGGVPAPGVAQSGVGIVPPIGVAQPGVGVSVPGVVQPAEVIPMAGVVQPLGVGVQVPVGGVSVPGMVQPGVVQPGGVVQPVEAMPMAGMVQPGVAMFPGMVQPGVALPPGMVQPGGDMVPPGMGNAGDAQTAVVEPNAKKGRKRRDKASKEANMVQPPQSGVFLGAPQGQPGQVPQQTPVGGSLSDSPQAEPAQKRDKKSGRKRSSRLPEPLLWVIEIAVWVVAAIILSTLLRLFVFQMFLVPSSSMEDTLQKNDRIAALKIPHYQRGDIIVFSDPGNWLNAPAEPVSKVHHFFEMIGLLASTDQQYLVKRVIGLPGDDVKCCSADGRLTVNGVELDESSYLKEPGKPASGIEFEVVVPAGHVFVMGDNRYDSADSRYHLCQVTPQGLGMNGFVPEENIVGPVRAVILPFARTGRRPVPNSVFDPVPSPQNAPPSRPFINVTSGLADTCHS